VIKIKPDLGTSLMAV